MGETVRKAYRLPVKLADELASYAESEGVSATDVVRRALGEYLQQTHDEDHSKAHSEDHDDAGKAAAIKALTTQLEVKDAQISRLMDALTQAQEMTRAAQMLEGAHVAKALAGDTTSHDVTKEIKTDAMDEEAHARSGILRRLWNWLHS